MLQAVPGIAPGGMKAREPACSEQPEPLDSSSTLQLFIQGLNTERSEAGCLLRGGICGRKEGTRTPPRDGSVTLLLPQPQS